MKEGGGLTLLCVEACWVVVIHSPAAVCNYIIESTFRFYIILCENIRTDISSAFALSGEETYPFKFPVICVMVASVLYVIPNTERYFKKLIAEHFGVDPKNVIKSQYTFTVVKKEAENEHLN